MTTSTDELTASFETAIGRCRIRWTDHGVRAVHLPGSHRLGSAAAEPTPPQPIARAIDGIVALLDGEPVDLSGVPADLRGLGNFDRSVAEAVRTIGPGETLTYGEVARLIGGPGQAREVGVALARNRVPIVVPCHRVVAAGGKLGGFSAPGGTETKRRLLAIEGRHVQGRPTLFDAG